MRTWRNHLSRRQRPDAGFTLVEMMVSLFVVGLVSTAFLGVLVGTLQGTQHLDARTHANQLAQDRLESVVSRPWAAVGLYAGDPGYVPTGADGQPTVTLDGSRPPGAPVPTETVAIRGGSYDVRTHVTWRDDPADLLGAFDRNGDLRDVKHVVVTVNWSVAGRTGRVTLDGQRAARVTEVPAAVAAGMTVNLTAPAVQTLTAAGHPTAPIGLTVMTSRAATTVTVTFPSTTGVRTLPMTAAASGLGTRWSLSVPTTEGPFATGSTTFTATATGAAGSGQGSAAVSMVHGAGATTFTATASSDQTLTPARTLRTPVTVSITSSAPLESASMTYSSSTGTVLPVPLTGSGTSWSATVPADSTVYNAGVLAFTISTRFGGGVTQTGAARVQLLNFSQAPPSVTAITVMTDDKFCTTNSDRLRANTEVRVTVSNLAQSDAVRLLIDNPSTNVPMTYVGTGLGGEEQLVFTYTIATSTQTTYPKFVTLRATATKTIDSVVLTDQRTREFPTQQSASCP